jgi:hypothetical protein
MQLSDTNIFSGSLVIEQEAPRNPFVLLIRVLVTLWFFLHRLSDTKTRKRFQARLLLNKSGPKNLLCLGELRAFVFES